MKDSSFSIYILYAWNNNNPHTIRVRNMVKSCENNDSSKYVDFPYFKTNPLLLFNCTNIIPHLNHN